MKCLQSVLVLVLLLAMVSAQNTNTTNTRIGGFAGGSGLLPGPAIGGGIGIPGGVLLPGSFQGGISGGIIHQYGLDCSGNSLSPQTGNCRYYLRNPVNRRYYCTRNQKPAYKCPLLRPDCPDTRSGPPVECYTDNDCGPLDKCCCDACLDHYVCKPAA
uniref:Pl-crustin 3 n=1 Tax=Pacifastacus leniusculus TaxID=6720 RepID=A5A3L3_PACLE|nr:Pl-crustin 3 [Pacifastacus leniusculus]